MALYILNNHRCFCFIAVRSFPDLDLDFDDLGGNLTWVEPTDDQFVEFYAIYQALPLEDGAGKGWWLYRDEGCLHLGEWNK